MTTAPTRSLTMPFLLAVTVFVAACSIAYELIVAKMIAELAGNPPLWESLTIGTYILCLGIGAFCFGRFKATHPLKVLLAVELLLTFAGAACGFIVLALHINYRIDFYDDGQLRTILSYPPIIWFALPAQLVAAAIGFLSGFELPALMQASSSGGNSRSEVKILVAYYAGTLLGTLTFAVAHAVNASNLSTALLTASVNLIVALALILALGGRSMRRRHWVAIGSLVLFLFTLSQNIERVTQLHAKNFYYNRHAWRTEGIGAIKEFFPVPWSKLPGFLAAYPDIERHHTKYQTIDIVNNGPSVFDPATHAEGFGLYINGRFQLSTASYKDYHQNLGVKPASITRVDADDVLILGGGDGLLAAAMLAGDHPPKSITLVDIDPEMISLSDSDARMLALNGGALSHPQVTVVVDDAFNFLRYSKRQFDAVFFDVTFPFDLDSARFSTVEIFRMARRHLTDRGYVAAPLPLNPEGPLGEQFKSLATQTLGHAGFRHLVTYSGKADSFLVTTTWAMQPALDDDSISEFHLTDGGNNVHSLLKPARFHVPDPFF